MMMGQSNGRGRIIDRPDAGKAKKATERLAERERPCKEPKQSKSPGSY